MNIIMGGPAFSIFKNKFRMEELSGLKNVMKF